jgi:rhodanese-related sulfurtransferase
MSTFKSGSFSGNARLFLWILILSLVFGFHSAARAELSVPAQKQTRLNLYVNAWQAWEKWSASPGTIHILDVRTPAEYIFIGHAPMAVNIPLTFFPGTVDPNTLRPDMPKNDHFIGDVKKRFKKTDTIFVMCRSGGRSAAAVNLMAEAGFEKVYNIIDGFEGDSLKDPDSYHYGKRVINGWKNSGAPWTYELERERVYLP